MIEKETFSKLLSEEIFLFLFDSYTYSNLTWLCCAECFSPLWLLLFCEFNVVQQNIKLLGFARILLYISVLNVLLGLLLSA